MSPWIDGDYLTPTNLNTKGLGSTVFNVTAYGAVGGDVVDDTAAIQAALAAAVATTGGRVYFPPFTYRITAALKVMASHTELNGPGAVIHQVTPTEHVITFNTTSVTDYGVVGLKLIGSSTAAQTNMSGVVVTDRCYVQDCDISGTNVGISTTQPAVEGRHRLCGNYIHGLVGTMPGQNYGINCTVPDCVILHNVISANRHAIYLSSGSGTPVPSRCAVIGNVLFGDALAGGGGLIEVYAADGADAIIGGTIIGNVLQLTNGGVDDGIAVDGRVEDLIILGNSITGPRRRGIAVGGQPGNAPKRIQVMSNALKMGNGDALNIFVNGQRPSDCAWIDNHEADGGTFVDGGTNTYRKGNRRRNAPSQGRAVLVGGTVTVATIEISANDNVQLTRVVAGGTLGHLSVGTIVDGTSFDINSSSATDTSTIFWEIIH